MSKIKDFWEKHKYATWWWKLIIWGPIVFVVGGLAGTGYIMDSLGMFDYKVEDLSKPIYSPSLTIQALSNTEAAAVTTWSDNKLRCTLKLGPPVKPAAEMILAHPDEEFYLEWLDTKTGTPLAVVTIPFASMKDRAAKLKESKSLSIDTVKLKGVGQADCTQETYLKIVNGFTKEKTIFQLRSRKVDSKDDSPAR